MSETSWQAGLRPWLVRELLRPTALARDVEAGWIGDLLGRSAWPELRLPLLAAWTAQWSADADDEAPELPVVHARPLGQSPPTAAPGPIVQVQLQSATKPTPAELPAAAPLRAALRPLRDPVSTPPLAHAPAAVLASTSSPAPSASSPAPSAASPASILTPRPRAPGSSDLAASVDAGPARPPAHAAATDDANRERPASTELPRVVAAFQRARLDRRGPAPAPAATGPRPAAPQDPIAGIAAPPATTTTTPTMPATDPPPLPRAAARAPIDAPRVDIDLAHTPGPSGHVARDSSPTPPPPPGPPRDELPRVPGEPPAAGRLAPAPLREAATPSPLPVAEARRPDAAPPRATPRDLSQSAAPSAAPPRAVLRPAEPARPVRARGLPGERAPLAVPAAWSGDPPAPTRPGPPRTELPHTHAPRPEEPRRAVPTIASSPVRTDIQPASPVAAPAPAPAPTIDIEALIDTVQRRLARELGRARELRRAIR